MSIFLEFIIFLIVGSIVLPNIYKVIVNYLNRLNEDPVEFTGDICLGGICLNKCDNLNGQEVKRTGNTALLKQDNIFQAIDCGEDRVVNDFRIVDTMCGDDGTETCDNTHCCYPKLCENDLNPLDGTTDYDDHYPDPGDKIIKKRRDGNCPYQQTVKKNTPCSGGVSGESGGCTDDGGVCCEDKKCSTHWDDPINTEWGSQTTCPNQPDNVQSGDMLKYPDDTPCDECGTTDCCYEQTNFCRVDDGTGHNHVATNVQNVNFPDGITSISFPGDRNTSVDLTISYFINKDDIRANTDNIQDILSFGELGGDINSNNDYGIKCEDDFKYGLCSSNGGSVENENTCKTHDNNQRECLSTTGCSFTMGIRPRVEYDECDENPGNSIIKVHDCIDTCTGDYTLSDNGINYFTQTPLDNGSYRVSPEFYSTKTNIDNDFPYSSDGTLMDCYNHSGSGNTLQYNYTCEGGGSYFGVSDLVSCTTKCSQLDSEGEICGQGNVYDETKADNISSYANFRGTGGGGCCKAMTCNTLSGGGEVSCLNHQKVFQTCTAKSGMEAYSASCEAVNNFEDSTECLNILSNDGLNTPVCDYNDLGEASRDSCCVNMTCNDFKNDYNSLSGENLDQNNICLNGRNFDSSRELTSAYLYQVSDSNDAKLEMLEKYRRGSAGYDIGCCSTLTCEQWLDNNLDALNIPDNDQKLSAASEGCGPDRFFIGNMNAGNMQTPPSLGANNSCCVGDSTISCNPTVELGLAGTDTASTRYNIPGYIISDGVTFGEKSFTMGNDGDGDNYFIDAENITCDRDSGFVPSSQGIKYKCIPNPSGGGSYYLSGCNDSSGTETEDKLCNLPSHLENAIQVNGFSFDAGNNVINYNHFLGNLDQFSCSESTETPIFTPCGENFTEMTIEGCHYQDKPHELDIPFYSDKFFALSEHNIAGGGRERTQGIDCSLLYTSASDNSRPLNYREELTQVAAEIYEKDPTRVNNGADAINKMKGNVLHFSCKCPQGNEECPDHERQVRFKYIFANEEDYYNGDNSFITNMDADRRSTSLLEHRWNGGIIQPSNCGLHTSTSCPDTCFLDPRSNQCQAPCNTYTTIEECPQSCVWDGTAVDNHLEQARDGGERPLNQYGCTNPSEYQLSDRLKQGANTVCELGYYPFRGEKYDYCRPCDDLYKNDNHPISHIADTFCDNGQLDGTTKFLDIEHNDDIMNSKYESNSNSIAILRAVRESSATGATGATSAGGPIIEYGPYLSDLTSINTDTNGDGVTDADDINFMTGDNFTLGARVCHSDTDTACLNKVKLYGDYSHDDAVEDSQFDKAKQWWRTYFNSNFHNTDDGVGIEDIENVIPAAPSSQIKPRLESTIDPNSDTDLKTTFRELRESGGNMHSLDHYNIDKITDLKKEHYLYRDNLMWRPSTGTTDEYISTVCNNNTPEVDYIPSFEQDSNEGECKACVNEMPVENALIPGGDAPPLNQPGYFIIRNINNDNYKPICSYEANMYYDHYNEGNIIDFQSKNGVAGNEELGPCDDGFIYHKDGLELYENQVDRYASGNTLRHNYHKIQDPPSDAISQTVVDGHTMNRSYVKCFPSTKIITRTCDQITEEELCNKSFSLGLSGRSEISRISGDDMFNLFTPEELGNINNVHDNGFCGWDDSDRTCKNIYTTGTATDPHLSYLTHKSPIDGIGETDGVEDYSQLTSLYKQQFAMDYLSPHITSYTKKEQYDYTKFYDILVSDVPNTNDAQWYNYNDPIPYSVHPTHDGNQIKGHDDDVFNIIHYGVAKPDGNAGGDDLTTLSIANTVKEGYGLSSNTPRAASKTYLGNYDRPLLRNENIQPTRINPLNTVLNDDMKNRCHPILWDGPVDFFYENGDSGHTISSSCYLRNDSTRLSSGEILPEGSGNYSIKSTPLYYDKGRKVNGGTIVNNQYDQSDRYYNILNPGENQVGLMYASRSANDPGQNTDSGFSDAAVFPLIDRVRGCFNDSLIYPAQGSPIPRRASPSAGLPEDYDKNNDPIHIAYKNEREQCIIHIDNVIPGINRDEPSDQNICINACLNNNECDLVRMTKINGTDYNSLKCELLKWNKLPANINTYSTNLLRDGDNPATQVDEAYNNIYLGSHLINANEAYEQSTREGVVNWFERIVGGQNLQSASGESRGMGVGELDENFTPSGSNYRTDFYDESGNWNNDLRTWRSEHLYNDIASGTTDLKYKGRTLWKTSAGDDDDNEIWVSMNKIRAPPPTGKIGDILTHINEHELPNSGIHPIDSWGEWRKDYTSGTNINEENVYYSNDSSFQEFPEKFNEKTVKDGDNYKQCPPGTYVGDSKVVAATDRDDHGAWVDIYNCSQVINECASCGDIYDYHVKKGDFEGMDHDNKDKFMLSYGCLADTGHADTPYVFIGSAFFAKHPSWAAGGTTTETDSGDNVLDVNGASYKFGGPFSGSGNTYIQPTFVRQHNLMAKTPDGNIIDAEKCKCPQGKTVGTRRTGVFYNYGGHRPIGKCE
jgi:hypothetical protein